MSLHRGIGGNATYRGFEARARLVQPLVPHPHDAQLKIELRQREWRHTAVAAQALDVAALCCFGFAALGPETDQSSSSFELPSAIGGSLVCRERLMVLPQRLQDCCTLTLSGGILGRNPIGVI